jgi:hypothetical protein
MSFADTVSIYRNVVITYINSSSVREKYQAIGKYYLYQNYPEPFNPSTTIKYRIPKRGYVTLKVYDILGNEIGTLVNEERPVGTYDVTWNAENHSSGVYFYQMKAGNFIQSRKMILLK